AVPGEPVHFEAEFLAEHPKHRDLRRQDAGLRELGEVQPLLLSERDRRQIDAARRRGLVERLARGGKLIMKVARHAETLRALTRQDGGPSLAHPNTPFSRSFAM